MQRVLLCVTLILSSSSTVGSAFGLSHARRPPCSTLVSDGLAFQPTLDALPDLLHLLGLASPPAAHPRDIVVVRSSARLTPEISDGDSSDLSERRRDRQLVRPPPTPTDLVLVLVLCLFLGRFQSRSVEKGDAHDGQDGSQRQSTSSSFARARPSWTTFLPFSSSLRQEDVVSAMAGRAR